MARFHSVYSTSCRGKPGRIDGAASIASSCARLIVRPHINISHATRAGWCSYVCFVVDLHVAGRVDHAEVRLVDVAGRERMGIEMASIEGPPSAIIDAADHVRDKRVGVQVRVGGTAGAVPEKRPR